MAHIQGHMGNQGRFYLHAENYTIADESVRKAPSYRIFSLINIASIEKTLCLQIKHEVQR